MKKINWLLLVTIFWLLLCGHTYAQNVVYEIGWITFSGGGGNSSGGIYSVVGSAGQIGTEKMTGGEYSSQGGFYSDIFNGPPKIYLPIILRNP